MTNLGGGSVQCKYLDLFNGHFSYERQKTKSRRADKAFISTKVELEAIPLFEKYRDKNSRMLFNFSSIFADQNIFNASINKELKRVAEACDIDNFF